MYVNCWVTGTEVLQPLRLLVAVPVSSILLKFTRLKLTWHTSRFFVPHWLWCSLICLYTCIYLWLYSLCGPWPLYQFLNLYTVGRAPWTGDQPAARPLPTHRTTQTQNKCTQTSMLRVGFETTIPVFERAKIVHALDRAVTVIGCLYTCTSDNINPDSKYNSCKTLRTQWGMFCHLRYLYSDQRTVFDKSD
jgi:hypothetical protein